MVYSLIGLLILILDIYCLYLIFTSAADTGKKVLWAILVIIFSPLGGILYLLLGR
jgi:hypothetical protein